jgi:fucose permease
MATIMAASTAIGRFVSGVLLRKIEWFQLLLACLIASSALVLLVMPLARGHDASQTTGWASAPLVAYLFPLIGLFLAPIYPAINSAVLSALPARSHAPMSGLIVVFSALGGTTGSMLTGAIFENLGGRSAFYFSLAPIALLTLCLFIFNKLQKQALNCKP